MKKLILVAVCALALPAFGANPGKPGKWEITTEIEMAGMPMKMPAQVHTICITKEDLDKNPEASVPTPANGKDSKCKISDYKVSGNSVTWSIKCEGENPVTGSGNITYSADTYKGSMDMKVGDHEMKAKYSGKWLGAECSKSDNR